MYFVATVATATVAHRSYHRPVPLRRSVRFCARQAGPHWRNQTRPPARRRYELTPTGITDMMTEIVLFPVVHRPDQRSPVEVLISEDIGATAVPPGERKFHSFLKLLFEFPPDVIGWHSVRVCGKEIDFALLLPGIGLFVIRIFTLRYRWTDHRGQVRWGGTPTGSH